MKKAVQGVFAGVVGLVMIGMLCSPLILAVFLIWTIVS